MSRTLLMMDGEKIPCPICHLVRGQMSYLELTGKRHVIEDRGLHCSNCDRQWESVRWFFDYFCTRTVPKIEAEMQERNIVHDREAEERRAEWEWTREKKVEAALEAGTWNPMTGDHLA